MSEDRIEVTYRLHVDPGDADELARAIAYEQTVELPERLPSVAALSGDVVGRVAAVEPAHDGEGGLRARIHYGAALASGQLPQLLNLLFGNVSMYPGVRLTEVRFPETFLARFSGPRFGVQGLRERLGVRARPLLATALKPRGTPVEDLARIAREFALGGGDLVKDDQNLVDADFEQFKRRTEACHRAVVSVNERTGRRCAYLPHVAAPAGELERYFEFAAALGVDGVLVCPLIMGVDTVRTFGERYGLLLMAHPALSGAFTNVRTQGIEPGLLLGTLFRLSGADISIFPNAGGRFAYTAEDCAGIRDQLRAPLGGLRPAWPCPAGGMRLDNLSAMGRDYGPDTVFLIGGALLGDSPSLSASTAKFLDAIRADFDERLEPPEPDPRRAQEPVRELVRHLVFEEGFRWSGRDATPYKDADDLAFKGVRRVELVGKFGERTRCDLRYFEVEPGGFTSLERHLHTHIIVGARGTGVLTLGNRRVELKPMDVVYVRPLEVHQLHNETREPFGFLCIVDHDRDRPMRP